MKHFNQHYVKMDDDELKYVIRLLSYFKSEDPPFLDEILLRMKRIAFPDEYEDPIIAFHKTIANYNKEENE